MPGRRRRTLRLRISTRRKSSHAQLLNQVLTYIPSRSVFFGRKFEDTSLQGLTIAGHFLFPQPPRFVETPPLETCPHHDFVTWRSYIHVPLHLPAAACGSCVRQRTTCRVYDNSPNFERKLDCDHTSLKKLFVARCIGGYV